MPCDFRIPAGWTPQRRKRQVADTIVALEAALKAQTVKVKVGPQGAVTFTGTWQRNGVSDVCAYRKLLASGSAALRLALAKAEALAGRKVDPKMVAAGIHSHDEGSSWDKGH